MAIFILYSWLLLLGFFMYAGIESSWSRLTIGIKVLVAPVVLVFGVLDVLFDTIFGSLMFLELPGWLDRRFTFSQRCEYHLLEYGFRGVIAGAYCFTLNSILPGHCRK